MASRETMGDVSYSESGYSSRLSSVESQLSTTLNPLENPPSCKSHPISTIQYHQGGRLQSKNVEEVDLDSKVLSHVLSSDECLEALNVNLKNLKLRLEKIPNNVSGVSIHVKEGTLENENLEEMYRITQKYCQEQFKMYDYGLDDRRTTFTTASEEVINHLSNPGAKRKLQEVGKKTRSVINVRSNCKITIKIGNIADEEVDVIVNSVHQNTTTSVGQSTVAGAIFEKGGRGFQETLVQKTSGRMEYGDIAVTEAGGNLRCKVVYHACLRENPSHQEEEVRKMTKMCLEKAVRDGHTSLSFPALGTGVYDYSGAASAKGLFNAIMEFFDTNKQLEKIGIVLFDGARRLVVESYQSEHRRRRCQHSTSALISLTSGCITAGNVTIVAENQQNIDNARTELENLVRALSTEDQQ